MGEVLAAFLYVAVWLLAVVLSGWLGGRDGEQ